MIPTIDMKATTQELLDAVFSAQSVPRLYNEDQAESCSWQLRSETVQKPVEKERPPLKAATRQQNFFLFLFESPFICKLYKYIQQMV
jgi:hypothetical protein